MGLFFYNITMKILFYLLLGITIISCGNSNSKDNFVIQAQIHGLQKGTVYLEKFQNEKLTVIDSVYVDDANENITFSNHINEADIYVISLDKSNTKHISFFGSPGNVTITTTLAKFKEKAKIVGAIQQDVLDKHDAYLKKINDENLEIIKNKFDARKAGDTDKLALLENKEAQQLKRQYLFSANYAIANRHLAVAPFIAFSRMPKASLVLKQKIYDALTDDIKKTKYGLLLKESLN